MTELGTEQLPFFYKKWWLPWVPAHFHLQSQALYCLVFFKNSLKNASQLANNYKIQGATRRAEDTIFSTSNLTMFHYAEHKIQQYEEFTKRNNSSQNQGF